MNNVVCEPIVKMTEYKMGGALEAKKPRVRGKVRFREMERDTWVS